jgi:hypothetical protein
MLGLDGAQSSQNFAPLFTRQPQAADDHELLVALAFVPALVAINADLGISKRAIYWWFWGGCVHIIFVFALSFARVFNNTPLAC